MICHWVIRTSGLDRVNIFDSNLILLIYLQCYNFFIIVAPNEILFNVRFSKILPNIHDALAEW